MSTLSYNVAEFYLWVLIPLVAEDWGASSTMLGVISGVCYAVYTVVVLPVGAFLTELPRQGILIRVGVVLALACVGSVMLAAGHLWVLVLSSVILAFADGVFWPAMETAIGRDAGPKLLASRLSLFGVWFAIGKAVGYCIGGWLKTLLGPTKACAAILGLFGINLLTVPLGTGRPKVKQLALEEAESSTPEQPKHETVDEARQAAEVDLFLLLSWIMNFTAYGVTVCIGSLYIKLIVQWGIQFPIGSAGDGREFFFGLFLGFIYISQTAVFVVGGLWHGWMFRRMFIYISQGIGVVCCLVLTFLRSPWALLVNALLLGVLAGHAYAASLTYSFKTKTKRKGCCVAIHEMVGSLSSIAFPPIAGALSDAFNEPRLPYFICAGLLLVTSAVQEIVYHVFWASWNRKHVNRVQALPDVQVEH